MDKFKEIRPIVLGIVKKDNKVLVSKGYDEVKDEGEYRYVKKAYCLENELRLVCENLILSFSFISFQVKKIYTLGD